LDATRLARALLGDAIFTNPFLMGYAFQAGRLPVSLEAVERAIELNARSVDLNKRAFAWGRLAAHDLAAVERAAGVGAKAEKTANPQQTTLEELVEQRARFLSDYQDVAYAKRYRALVDRASERERAICGDTGALSAAVARYYAKVLAYKDEYEVARLMSDGSFRRQLEAEFEGPYKLQWHAAPPHMPVIDWLTDRRDPDSGRTRKIVLGAWIFRVLAVLARFKFLRGKAIDPFGRHAHRRLERQQIADYETLCEEIFDGLQPDNVDTAVELASLPEHVRGFDSVKEEQLAAVQDKRSELLDAFRRSAPAH
jgi:indolepyruvate ferredoxin oxidoreductase